MGSPPPVGDRDAEATRTLYIELLKRALTHTLYTPLDVTPIDEYDDPEAFRAALEEAAARGELDLGSEDSSRQGRDEGRDWPKYAQTMVGLRRLENVQQCVERVLADGIPGDLIETGVWRGGVSIFMRGLLKAHGDRGRIVFAADSFCGLPPPDGAYPADEGNRLHTLPMLEVSLDDVKLNFSLYDLLDEQVRFLEGWFKDTLPTVRDRTWAVVRLDGDMYQSTIDALVNLYPGLSVGGFVIIDDYGLPACAKAVHDFRAEHGIADEIQQIDWIGAFWRRSR